MSAFVANVSICLALICVVDLLDDELTFLIPQKILCCGDVDAGGDVDVDADGDVDYVGDVDGDGDEGYEAGHDTGRWCR